jgi:Gram-negative bacterial TonB protein C-terminal
VTAEKTRQHGAPRVISSNGDVIALGVLDGPTEHVVSAVNAVRKRKYRPYQLLGQPVEVSTQFTVNYTLSGLQVVVASRARLRLIDAVRCSCEDPRCAPRGGAGLITKN